MYNHYTKYQGAAHGRWITIHGSSSLGGGRRAWQIAITANFLGRLISHSCDWSIVSEYNFHCRHRITDEMKLSYVFRDRFTKMSCFETARGELVLKFFN
jgi:hypothetical protein